MEQKVNPNQNPTHFRSFWPIVVIAVLSAVVGGLIVWVTFTNNLQSDVDSLFLKTHRAPTGIDHGPGSISKTPVKK